MADTNTNNSISTSLSNLKDQFFSSIQEGTEALAAFHDAWLAFSEALPAEAEDLEDDVADNVYSFATIVSTVSSGLLAIEAETDTILDQFHQEVAAILQPGMEALSLQGAECTQTEPISSMTTASEWLIDNLHNPYPSQPERAQLAAQCGVSLKSLDSWFTEARRRIGWNKIRKNHFNTRAQMIQAASRYFCHSFSAQTKPLRHQSPSLPAIKGDFDFLWVEMECLAKELYSTYSHSCVLEERAVNLADSRTSYPSPPRSPSRSPSPLLCFSPPADSKKRRRGSDSSNLPSKKHRSNPTYSGAVSSLPSPASSSSSLDDCDRDPSRPTASRKRKAEATPQEDGARKRYQSSRSFCSVPRALVDIDTVTVSASPGFELLEAFPPSVVVDTVPKGKECIVSCHQYSLDPCMTVPVPDAHHGATSSLIESYSDTPVGSQPQLPFPQSSPVIVDEQLAPNTPQDFLSVSFVSGLAPSHQVLDLYDPFSGQFSPFPSLNSLDIDFGQSWFPQFEDPLFPNVMPVLLDCF